MKSFSIILFAWLAFGLRGFAQDVAPVPKGEPARGDPGNVRDERSGKATDPVPAWVEKFVNAKLDRIIFPRLEFKEATIREAIDFLKRRTVELDPEPDPVKKGMGILLRLESR